MYRRLIPIFIIALLLFTYCDEDTANGYPEAGETAENGDCVWVVHRTTEVMEPVLEDIGEVLRTKTAVKWGVNINHVVKKKAY